MTQTVFQTPTGQNAVVDFAPQKDYLSFSQPINQTLTLTIKTGAGVTFTYGEVLGGLIFHDTSSGAVNDTFPTAALLVPQIEGAEVGSTVRLIIRNTSAGAGTITLVAGTGCTLSGTTASTAIAYLTQTEYLIRVTAVGASPTYTVYGLGNTTF